MKKSTITQKRSIKIIAIITSVYVALMILPWTGPYAQYPLHVVRCFKLPVLASRYTESYQTLSNRFYSVSPFTSDFFCSEQEAQVAGFEKAGLGE